MANTMSILLTWLLTGFIAMTCHEPFIRAEEFSPPDVDGWSSCKVWHKYPATHYRVFGATQSTLNQFGLKNCYELIAADATSCQLSDFKRPDFAILLALMEDDWMKLRIVTNAESIEMMGNETEGLRLFVDSQQFSLKSSRQADGNLCAIAPSADGTAVTFQNRDFWARFNGSTLELRLRRSGASTETCGWCDPIGYLVRAERTTQLLYNNGWLKNELAHCEKNRRHPFRPIIWDEGKTEDAWAKRMGFSDKCEVNASSPIRSFDGSSTASAPLSLPSDGCYAVLAADAGSCGHGFIMKPSYVILGRRLDDKRIRLKVIRGPQIYDFERRLTAIKPVKLFSWPSTFRDSDEMFGSVAWTQHLYYYDGNASDFFLRFDGARFRFWLQSNDNAMVEGIRPAQCGACFGGGHTDTAVLRAWLSRHGALDDQPEGCQDPEETARVLDTNSATPVDSTSISLRLRPTFTHLISIQLERVCASHSPIETCIAPYRPVYLPPQPFYEPDRRPIVYNNTAAYRCYDKQTSPDATKLIEMDDQQRAVFERRPRNTTAGLDMIHDQIHHVNLVVADIDVRAARRHQPISYREYVHTPNYCIPPAGDEEG